MSYTSVNTTNKSILYITLILLSYISVIDLNALPTKKYARRPLINRSIAPPADTVYFIRTTKIVGHATNCNAETLEKDEGIAKTMYCRAIKQDAQIEYRYADPLLSSGTRRQNIHRFSVHSDTLSIVGGQHAFFFDDEPFILRYLTPQYQIRLDTTSIKQHLSSARPPLTLAQKIEECITSTGHGKMEISMKKSHDVWNLDDTYETIVGHVYHIEKDIFADKMNLTLEQTLVLSVANYSTTYQIDFQKVEDQKNIQQLRSSFY